MNPLNEKTVAQLNYRDELLPLIEKGFFSNHKQLDAIFQQNKIKNVLELGSFLGLSTRFFAERAEKVIAVDTWFGSREWYQPHRTEMHPLLNTLYEQFISNMHHWNIVDKVIPIKSNTDDFFSLYQELEDIDLVYIDADHATLAVTKDIQNSLKYCKNASVTGDDYRWESVKMALESWKDKIYSDKNFWRMK